MNNNIPNPPWHGVMTGTDINRAFNWRRDHVAHVKSLVQNAGAPYPPTDKEDIRNPALWKAEHWAWYFHVTNTHP